MGVGIMFQRSPTISGLKLSTLINTAFSENCDSKTIMKYANSTNMIPFLDRDVNVGFSGGEMKRSELLQLLLQNVH